MTEILFRGKCKSLGEWLYGQYIQVCPVDMPEKYRKNKAVIFPTNAKCNWYGKYFYYAREVVPETVGQWTGLTDANGSRIFEGDIVQNKFGQAYAVRMDPGRCGWYPFACGDGCGCCEEETEDPRSCIVIGNIHDEKYLESSR